MFVLNVNKQLMLLIFCSDRENEGGRDCQTSEPVFVSLRRSIETDASWYSQVYVAKGLGFP